MEQVIRFFVYFLHLIGCWYAKIFHRDQKNQIPPVRDPILLLRATEIAERIKQKKVCSLSASQLKNVSLPLLHQIKAEDVIKAYLRRIDEVNPKINAIVEIRKEAVEDAKKIDQLLSEKGDEARNENGDRLMDLPLLGVPFTSKDGLEVKGMLATAGLVDRKNKRADCDDICITNLRNAGAIPMAVSNVPEIWSWVDSHNEGQGLYKVEDLPMLKLLGPTLNKHPNFRNPYDLSRIPGGSSGGDAANIASAGGIISPACDVGGSVRLPAFFNCLYGHMTTFGVIPKTFKYPKQFIGSKKGQKLFSSGPITRYATDLRPTIKALAGEAIFKLPKIDSKVNISKIRVFYMESSDDPFKSSLHPEMRSAVRKVVEILRTKYNATCTEYRFEEFNHTSSIMNLSLKEGANVPFKVAISNGKDKVIPALEVLKRCFGLSKHSWAAILYALLEDLPPSVTSPFGCKILRMRDDFKDKLCSLLGDDGVFVLPSFTQPGLKHGNTITKFSDFSLLTVFNSIQIPGTCCPIGLSSEGIPLGVKIATSPFNDHLSLALAEELEKTVGGWIPPCKIFK